ncbi:hypothetical protein ACLOJK_038934 [Asimina triloba]
MVVVERDLLVDMEHVDLGCRRGISPPESLDMALLMGGMEHGFMQLRLGGASAAWDGDHLGILLEDGMRTLARLDLAAGV